MSSSAAAGAPVGPGPQRFAAIPFPSEGTALDPYGNRDGAPVPPAVVPATALGTDQKPEKLVGAPWYGELENVPSAWRAGRVPAWRAGACALEATRAAIGAGHASPDAVRSDYSTALSTDEKSISLLDTEEEPLNNIQADVQ